MVIKKKIIDMKRVWRVTKKPSKEEYLLTAKIVAIGFLIIGLIGFIMELLWHFVLKYLFK